MHNGFMQTAFSIKTFSGLYICAHRCVNIDTLKFLIRQTEENRIEFFQGRYIYKNKYQEAMESLKKAEGIYLKEKDFLFEKMKDLSESCSMYEENNRILQEDYDTQSIAAFYIKKLIFWIFIHEILYCG